MHQSPYAAYDTYVFYRLICCKLLQIPCRTAMRGSVPLNGTYFQVNEVRLVFQ
ncbi:hypothetical protein J0680_24820 [Vibrio parahaemolyticus]|nr:hypothetical protein [Vibrio parahaemolyticus]